MIQKILKFFWFRFSITKFLSDWKAWWLEVSFIDRFSIIENSPADLIANWGEIKGVGHIDPTRKPDGAISEPQAF